MRKFDAFQVVADPCRRRILQLLSKQGMSVNSLASNFEISRPAVSKHVKLLDHAGFISVEVRGREHYCVLKEDGFMALQDWLAYFDHFWRSRSGHLQQILSNGEKGGME